MASMHTATACFTSENVKICFNKTDFGHTPIVRWGLRNLVIYTSHTQDPYLPETALASHHCILFSFSLSHTASNVDSIIGRASSFFCSLVSRPFGFLTI